MLAVAVAVVGVLEALLVLAAVTEVITLMVLLEQQTQAVAAAVQV